MPFDEIVPLASPNVSSSVPSNVPPSVEVPEPPRALSAGALLRGEFEVKEVVSRGLTNLYEAQVGDYGATVAVLIAERETPTAVPAAVPAAAPASPASSTGLADVAPPAGNDEVLVNDAASAGAFVEDVDALPVGNDAASGAPMNAAPTNPALMGVQPMGVQVPVDESDPTGEMSRSSVPPSAQANEIEAFKTGTSSQNAASTDAIAASPFAVAPASVPQIGVASAQLESPLFPRSGSFSQEDRDYLVFKCGRTTSLQDYRAPTNDECLLVMLTEIAQGLRELSHKNLHADFTTDTLRVNEAGVLRFFGFVEPKTVTSPTELEQLSTLTAFLMKRVYAESSTMRLDDEFGSLAFSEEVKNLARRINDDTGFADMDEAADAITILNPSTRLRAESAIVSDVGRERELNEDAGFISKLQRRAHLGSRDLELYVVADGMGGHEGGEVASDLTLSSLQRHLDERVDLDWDDNVAVRNALVEIIDQVNAEVVALTETPRYRGTRAKPGSTLVFGLRLGARVFVGNVGDSRAYKISNGVLERISKDHSYVQTLIDRGEITDEEAFDHPEGSVITAHIGFAKLKQRDVFLRLFAPGDKLLLVSDGVTDMLRDREYAPHIASNDPQLICQSLVDASNAAGGADNITVVCAQFSG
jgi:protein phosphatase